MAIRVAEFTPLKAGNQSDRIDPGKLRICCADTPAKSPSPFGSSLETVFAQLHDLRFAANLCGHLEAILARKVAASLWFWSNRTSRQYRAIPQPYHFTHHTPS